MYAVSKHGKVVTRFYGFFFSIDFLQYSVGKKWFFFFWGKKNASVRSVPWKSGTEPGHVLVILVWKAEIQQPQNLPGYVCEASFRRPVLRPPLARPRQSLHWLAGQTGEEKDRFCRRPGFGWREGSGTPPRSRCPRPPAAACCHLVAPGRGLLLRPAAACCGLLADPGYSRVAG